MPSWNQWPVGTASGSVLSFVSFVFKLRVTDGLSQRRLREQSASSRLAHGSTHSLAESGRVTRWPSRSPSRPASPRCICGKADAAWPRARLGSAATKAAESRSALESGQTALRALLMSHDRVGCRPLWRGVQKAVCSHQCHTVLHMRVRQCSLRQRCWTWPSAACMAQ